MPPAILALTGPSEAATVRRFTGLPCQQVGETGAPGRRAAAAAALQVVGSTPTASQVLVQQPAQGADAFFIWRRGKNKLRQGECARLLGRLAWMGVQRRAMDCHRREEQGPS